MNNPKVKINGVKNLSHDWYKLDKVNFDYQTKNGEWQNQTRDCYDRGDGACILLYNPSEKKVILTKHHNAPGVLLILLSALASKNINIKDLRLGKLNETGYSAIAVKGDSNVISNLLNKLGDQYYEANLIEFHSF